ncbi:hypothetical protein [Daejeonella sp.]|uniref:hypothetical protein n=1 Tax=Daejeonella sp. TaxID=2805397 RepID=UPI003983C741
MNRLFKLTVLLVLFLSSQANAQEKKKKPFTIGGEMGMWYEGYGLNKAPSPAVPDFYQARRPWNLFRYSLNPTLTVGKLTVPFNFNFSPTQNNFITAATAGPQSIWQFLTNPVNNFGISPKIGTTELLLGTQNLQYSELSTGDLGVFGYGVNLAPGKFRIKLFNGVSQRPVNYLAPTIIPASPGVIGAYQRNQWMAQLGLEKEGKYFAGFNFVKSIDKRSSVTSAPISPLDPQENMVVSFLAKVSSEKGWNYHIEIGQSFFTRNLNTPLSASPVNDFKPFLSSHTSTGKDNAVMTGIIKKGKDWEAGAKFNYYGAGYYTAGYPFMNNDRMEYLANTRFNVWKKKMNVVASVGQRFGNLSRIAGPSLTKQIIANVNVFTQFNERFSLNTSFNNFGFNSPGLSGYRSVSDEISINPAYTWNNSKMSQLVSGTYTWSKYDETTIIPASTTQNNTQTVLILYVPTFFNKKISPDFSLMWFRNTAPSLKLNLLSATTGMNWKPAPKINVKGQLQYSLSTVDPFTASKNLLATSGFDWDVYKKLTWQFSMTANLYHYGTELPGSSFTPAYPGSPEYLESTLRTGLQYKF